MKRFGQKLKTLPAILPSGGWPALGAAAGFAALCAALLWGRLCSLPFDDLEFVARMPWALLAGVFAGTAALLLALCLVWENAKPLFYALPGGCAAFALLLSLALPGEILFALGLCVPLWLCLKWTTEHSAPPQIKMPNSNTDITIYIAIGLFLAFTGMVSYFSIIRYRSYNATNFDLGIFAQMFESMRHTGQALTTLERNAPLNHFAVHCSPFYYLLLPFYWLAPRVETLLALQAAGVGAGVFAIRAIARRLGCSRNTTIAACLLYLGHPGIALGCIYDFHENKFLAVLLLWTVYFLLEKKLWPTLLFAALTLSVKEDAAIYIAALGLYALLGGRKEWKEHDKKLRFLFAGLLIGMSAAWFFAAAALIRRHGGEVMVSRLRNYYLPGEGGQGFADVVKVLLSNPGYMIKEVFTREKTEFLLWMLLPLGFAPLAQKRGSRWLLLLPLLAINLLSNYDYQHSVKYQYTFGSAALLLVLAIWALRDMAPALRRRILLISLCACLLTTVPVFHERVRFYQLSWSAYRAQYTGADAALAALPREAEITATTFFCPRLSGRAAPVYMFPNYYGPSRVTEYLVCQEEDFEMFEGLEEFLDQHYTLLHETSFARIYLADWAFAEQIQEEKT
ncbi:MAG: DUF2079 domain-containing protein [Oscillospiraceae bacterium]|nr:DUF2079 domain-containing protein [Oscillospiraceae bacterium]